MTVTSLPEFAKSTAKYPPIAPPPPIIQIFINNPRYIETFISDNSTIFSEGIRFLGFHVGARQTQQVIPSYNQG
jgi:hypothetical protein